MVGTVWSVGLGMAWPPRHGGLWGALSRDRAEQLMAGGAACTHCLEGALVTLLQRHVCDVQVLPHQQQLVLLAQLEGVTLQIKGTGSGH